MLRPSLRIKRSRILNTGNIEHVMLDEGGLWRLFTSEGDMLFATLHGETFISHYLIILVFKVRNRWKRRRVAVIRGTMHEEEFRRLFVHLRFSKHNVPL